MSSLCMAAQSESGEEEASDQREKHKEKGSSQFSDSESFCKEFEASELENAKQEFEAMVGEATWVSELVVNRKRLKGNKAESVCVIKFLR